MAQWKPDPTFYPSPKHAMQAPPEELAYVSMLDPTSKRPDALGVVDVKPASNGHGRLVGQVDMPNTGDELRSSEVGRASKASSSCSTARWLLRNASSRIPLLAAIAAPDARMRFRNSG